MLCVFPKLVTGDYAKVTITNTRISGGRLRIEMFTTRSADTGIGAELPNLKLFGIYVLESECNGWFPTSPGWIPTWPWHGRRSVTLGFRGDAAKGADGTLASLLAVRTGETYYVTPSSPLKLLAIQEGSGRQDLGALHLSRGSRLGLKP